jgi:hypothetical protein
LHPGGKGFQNITLLGVLLNIAGKDSTEEFFALHRKEVLE